MNDTVDNSLTDLNDHNLPVFSVGELSSAVKQTVEGAFHHVRVRGELSGFKRAASGHLYFALKDDAAVLDSVCWRGTAAKLAINPEDGMEVIVTGRVTTYAGRSKYQIIIESMELAGEGALLKLLEDRKKRLAEEGLFDAGRKQELPYLPDTIGVVTSPTGAVIRDILHRLNDRFPRDVILWPVIVQGETAADQITKAIRGFNALPENGPVTRPDILIVARGGGSLEDLWSFNEENVARAVAESAIPVISAVGHETDTTLIDFVSDVRAPTPTAAAEMAVPVRMEIMAAVSDMDRRMGTGITRQMEEGRAQLTGLSRGLPNLRRIIDETTQRLDEWEERLNLSLIAGMKQRENRFSVLVAGLRHPEPIIRRAVERLSAETRSLKSAATRLVKDRATALKQTGALLESYSYKSTLARGFALVTDSKGASVKAASDVSQGMALSIEFHDGHADVMAAGEKSKEKPNKVGKKTRKKTDTRQGTLL
ncbi:MAG: exodeoxyribonuclease VII large subunit [Rhodospirillales bacterium]|nr:exodeoxyribonuclease VII large subunit [Rhodospirillales bacterium]MBT4040025.1 exodeoxyribonuclease VII large subunit [Rhodospirillales bacterium]MBT4627876.1 exodeoxyribonuclease VII large subunit [Rhodospirillales bacterium]MBT5351416.1 exodeoxyribonuclease VII large subunit [Rhodospirillales bacterium]MBT5521995.1 exodeoxyribonuclease VII large subunit [Rhodospirillales bacterium]